MLFVQLLLCIVFFDFKNAVKRFTFNQCYLGISWTNMHSGTHIAYVKYNITDSKKAEDRSKYIQNHNRKHISLLKLIEKVD